MRRSRKPPKQTPDKNSTGSSRGHDRTTWTYKQSLPRCFYAILRKQSSYKYIKRSAPCNPPTGHSNCPERGARDSARVRPGKRGGVELSSNLDNKADDYAPRILQSSALGRVVIDRLVVYSTCSLVCMCTSVGFFLPSSFPFLLLGWGVHKCP